VRIHGEGEMKTIKANYEIRIFNKNTRKAKVFSIFTKLKHEKLKQKIIDVISEISEISRTGLWWGKNKK